MDRRPGILWTLGALIGLLLACCIPSFQETGEKSRPKAPRGLLKREPPTPDGDVQVLRFAWEDLNSVPVMERRDDTFVTQGQAQADRYALSYRMDLERLRWATASYGVPDGWTQYVYVDEEDQATQFEEARARCARRGIRLDREGDSLQVSADGDWIVQNSRADLTSLTRDLYDAAVDKGRTDQRDFLGVAASFVQGLEYKIPPDKRTAPDGTRLTTCGVTMPLETLHNGWGDCDTKCFLLASVLSNVDGLPMVILEGEHHMFLGVACAPRAGDRYVTVQGTDFVLIETTTPWPLGAIPRSIEDGLQANRYQVTPLNTVP